MQVTQDNTVQAPEAPEAKRVEDCSGVYSDTAGVILILSRHLAHSMSAIFRDLSCAATGCRWCGISC